MPAHDPFCYEEVGRRYAESLARSRRQSLFHITLAVLSGWTDAEINTFVATGEQPAGKPAILKDPK